MADAFDRYRELETERPELFSRPTGGPYAILSPQRGGGEVLFENGYCLALQDWVAFPDGGTGPYMRMIVPPDGTAGVAILPVTKEGILLLRHPRHATGRQHLEIPRGFGEAGETPWEASRRELLEETGIDVRDLVSLGAVYPDTGMLSTRVELFAATIAGMIEVRTEPGVTHEIRTASECHALVSEGTIDDGFTIAALMRAGLRGII